MSCESTHVKTKKRLKKWNPSVSLSEKEQKHYFPGQNYSPSSRVKKLLAGYQKSGEKPIRTVVTVSCPTCEFPMTKVLRKTKEEKEQHMIESAWKTLEDVQGYREKADFQRTFERWWKGVARSSHSVKVSVRESEELMRWPSVPHHMYHHILHNQGCEGRKEARRRVDQTTICMDCPDPYRSWIRGNAHPYNPLAVRYPLSSRSASPITRSKKGPKKLLLNRRVLRKTFAMDWKREDEKARNMKRSSILRESLKNVLRKIIRKRKTTVQ